MSCRLNLSIARKGEKSANFFSKVFLCRYSLISIPLAFVGLPLYIHVPKFYFDCYQVDLRLLGFVLLILRLGDAFLDPLIGYLSDRYKSFLKAIMTLGGGLLILGFNGLFWPPNFFTRETTVVWFFCFTAISYVGYSILAINFYGVGLTLAGNYEQRTILSSWREGFGLLGILLAALLPSLLEIFYPKMMAFQIYAAIMAGTVVLGLFIFPRLKIEKSQKNSLSFRIFDFVSSSQNSVRWLFLLLFTNALPVGVTSTLFLFYTESVLKAQSQAGPFLITYFLAAAFSAVFWPVVSKKWGKRNTLYLSMSLAILSFMGTFYLTQQCADLFYLVCFFSGFALGGDLVLLPSLLADGVADKLDSRNMTFSLWHFINKTALALTTGLLFLFLPALSGSQVSPYSPVVLQWSYAIIPCVMKVVAVIILYISPLDKGREKK